MQLQDRIGQHASHIGGWLRQSRTESAQKDQSRTCACYDQTTDHEVITDTNKTAGRDIGQATAGIARPNGNSFASILKAKAKDNLPQFVQPTALCLGYATGRA